ncbi:MFS transporter [Streptomyces sp. NPDC001661]
MTATAQPTAPGSVPHRVRPGTVAFASLLGTAIEWYDFYIYATASALVFGSVFFSDAPDFIGTLAAFATYFVGFVVRPLGAVIFGHFGDRLGRKASLITTLMMMGVATFAVGLLPSYSSIGIWAPILLVLLRCVQGLAVGGEWGGAVLMAVEHAPPRRRAFYGSFPQLGSPVGLVLATLVYLGVTAGVGSEQFSDWGWRVPFLLSAVLVAVGLGIRLKISESPLFTEAKKDSEGESAPVKDVVRSAWRQVLVTAGASWQSIGVFLICSTFMISYGTDRLGISRDVLLDGQLYSAIFMGIIVIASAFAANKFGGRRVAIFGAAVTVVSALPTFWLVLTKETVLVWAGMCFGQLGQAISYGALATIVSAMFPTRLRYSGIAIGYALSSVLGGLVPLLSTWLVELADGSWWPIAVYYTVMGATSLVCLISTRRLTQHMSGSELGEEASAAPEQVATAG